jgi:hypothetical protein
MRNVTRILACGVAAVSLVAVSGVAQAGLSKGKGPAKAQRAAKAHRAAKAQRATRAARACGKRVHLKRSILKTAAAHIGITPRQLARELPGNSLAQVAQAHNKTAAGLQTALVDSAKAALAKRVANQKITQQVADQRLARFQSRVGMLVNRVFPERAGVRCARIKVRHVALNGAAQFLGLTRAQLRQQARGHSLAQLAEGQNKSVADLQAAMVNAVKAALDKAVANQRLTQARADKILARFQDRVDELVGKVRSS